MLTRAFGAAAVALLALSALLIFSAGSGAPKDTGVDDVNHRNADGSTPLQWAVYEGDVAEVRRLLDAGADVSLANEYGATAMSLAAEVADTEMLKLLLAAGADADSPNAEGQDGADGRGANRQRGSCEGPARARRHGRCTRRLRRTDRSHVGVCTPASTR